MKTKIMPETILRPICLLEWEAYCDASYEGFDSYEDCVDYYTHKYCIIWINSSTPITLTAEDEKVGVDEIYWRNTLVDDDACLNPIACYYSDWVFEEETPDGYGAYVTGPDTPPAGVGSANLVTKSGGGMALIKYGYNGMPLSDITTLNYSTYQSASSQSTATQQIALQLNIDYDCTDGNTGWQGRLVLSFRIPTTIFSLTPLTRKLALL